MRGIHRRGDTRTPGAGGTGTGGRRASGRLPGRLALVGLLIALAVGALGIVSMQASAAGAVSPGVDRSNGFPHWYQDAAGTRVEPCIDPNDANCALLPGPTFDPAQPLAFPTNFPDEFFYANADSDIVPTPGCGGTAPGKASVRIALEGAFVNGDPVAGEQMVFGRIRVKVTSGLCPNTAYRFHHPYGVETFTTNDAGAIPANFGTEDIGCKPVPPAKCDFTQAEASRVLGTAASGGFLHWDAGAPTGYLGDGATPHTVAGGTDPANEFRILEADGTDTGLSTNLFTVTGKKAGSLQASSSPLDFGGQAIGVASDARTVTITNLDSGGVTVGPATLEGTSPASFTVTSDGCSGTTLARDKTCAIQVTFTAAGAGREHATLSVPSTGGVRSPLDVALTGYGTTAGQAPALSLDTGTLAFPDTRVHEIGGPRTVTITNTGTAPLGVSGVALDPATQPETDHYLVLTDTCSTGQFVDPGESCAVAVDFVPLTAAPHPSALRISSNAASSPDSVALTGTGTGGVSAVSPTTDPSDGFPDWYRDENGVKLAQCIDPEDPNCIVLGDDFFDPAQPLSFPTNFPSEFFYQVATSDNVATPGCAGSPPGRAFVRTAAEAAFPGGPAPNDQMVFGRIRIVVTSGLCPNTTYRFVHPYGTAVMTTNAAGAIPRNAGTEDIGCLAPLTGPCDFSLALSSRVFASFVRWDPAVAPQAPPGYLGDAATLHTIVGAPYKPDGVTPANYFRIENEGGSTTIGETKLFTVMGKLRGPLESSPEKVAFGTVRTGTTSAPQTVALSNTGTEPLDVSTLSIGGTDGADFAVNGAGCTGVHLAPGASCDVSVTFSPSATGARSALLIAHHSGLNNPLSVQLSGIGGAGAAALSFVPRSVSFAPLHVGRASAPVAVTVSNAGGSAPLTVSGVAVTGEFAVLSNGCTASVAPGGSCRIDVVFAPQTAAAHTAVLRVTDNAPGSPHTMSLSGIGTGADPAVATSLGTGGFPDWYQDSNGVRVAPCLDAANPNCIVLADEFFDPAQPLNFPTNFPGEFFYQVADSDIITTPGCGGTPQGKAFLRTALEGSFANGAPAAGDQTTFGRIRVVVTSGLCPNTPYHFDTPYGRVDVTTNGVGGFPRNAGTTDVGCAPVAPATCDFSEALGSRVADSFLRWDPNAGAPAPDGYLGDAVTLHRVVGGTYTPGGGAPVNSFSIRDSAEGLVGSTDLFKVSGKIVPPTVIVAPATPPAPATLADAPAAPAGTPPAGAAPPVAGAAPQALGAPAPTGTATIPALGLARVATVKSIRVAAITRVGIPVTVKVPALVKVLRFRILNARRKVLFTAFKTAAAGKQVKLNLRSPVLRKKLVPGKRYVLEVTPGTARTALGRPSLTTFMVRR